MFLQISCKLHFSGIACGKKIRAVSPDHRCRMWRCRLAQPSDLPLPHTVLVGNSGLGRPRSSPGALARRSDHLRGRRDTDCEHASAETRWIPGRCSGRQEQPPPLVQSTRCCRFNCHRHLEVYRGRPKRHSHTPKSVCKCAKRCPNRDVDHPAAPSIQNPTPLQNNLIFDRQLSCG
jgi:hypothetical protein